MKADFYLGLDWIGSIKEGGEIWNIPLSVLIQINQTMFEEEAIEYIKACGGIVASHPCEWPWQWADSRMTDYTYIFHPSHNKVFASENGSDLLDPVKLVQGYSVEESYAGIVAAFPIMKKEEIYGYTPSQVI